MTTLQNKTALVTGASRGIGRATALALARAGARVLVHYGRSAQEAESLVAEIRTKGGHADAFPADLGTPEGASLLAKQVRSIVGDRLDVLVLNAGISKAARITDYTVEDFDSLFATNVLLMRQMADLSATPHCVARWPWESSSVHPLGEQLKSSENEETTSDDRR
jgi:3-oxoacyl-[acyl-carrier protein] reductase